MKMGIADNAQHERKGRKNAAVTKRVTRGDHEPADWGSVNPQYIGMAIATVAKQGGALRFGYTSDGGAYALGIYGDGDPYTEYFRPGEDIEGFLNALTENWA